jgi:cytidine deaminase
MTVASLNDGPAAICLQVVLSMKKNGADRQVLLTASGCSLCGRNEKQRRAAEAKWLTYLARKEMCFRAPSLKPRICAEEPAEYHVLKELRTDLRNRVLDWVTYSFNPRTRLECGDSIPACDTCRQRIKRIFADHPKITKLSESGNVVRFWDLSGAVPELLAFAPSNADVLGIPSTLKDFC